MPDYYDGSVNEDPDFTDTDYESFERDFRILTGIELSLYKEKQMRRRINTLIRRKGLGSYAAFLSLLRSNSAERTAFIDYITINVTEFFRTPEHWQCMETEALTDLLQRKEKIKVWSTACATGEEAYSLAMSLLQRTDPSRFHILATDLDEKVLRTARQGIYSMKTVEKLPAEIRDRFFTGKVEDVQVTDEVRACVEFRRMDLLQDPFPTDCDLIVCRNVLIYFTEEAKDRIYLKFKQSLSPDGWLFTGNTEQIIYYKKFGFRKAAGFLYRNDGTAITD